MMTAGIASVVPVTRYEDVEGVLSEVIGEQAQGVVDRLQEQAFGAGHDRGYDIDQLGEVGDPNEPAVPDERMQEGGDGEGVSQGVALLEPFSAFPLAKPHVPLVVGHEDRVADALVVTDLLDQGAGDAQRPLHLVRRQDISPVVVAARVDVQAVEADEFGQPLENRAVLVAPPVLAA
jgi:hypothetical protein